MFFVPIDRTPAKTGHVQSGLQVQLDIRGATLHTIGVARRTCTQQNVKFGLEGSFEALSDSKNA
jgi:hypothetical protein